MGDIFPAIFAKKFNALGTEISIYIAVVSSEEERKAEKDLPDLLAFYKEKEMILSRFNPESELSKLNGNLNRWQKASPDVRYLAVRSLEYHEKSGKLFDPRILDFIENIGYRKSFNDVKKEGVEITPSVLAPISSALSEELKINDDQVFFKRRMDFTGIAKGYITDQASQFLQKKGWRNFLLDSGGDMRAAGANENGLPWRIGLEGVAEKEMICQFTDAGVATSGISRRKWESGGKRVHHLVHPQNPGHFSFQLKSVTAFAATAEEADMWAKVLFLAGKEKGVAFSEKQNVAAIFLEYRGNALVNNNARNFIIRET